VRTIALARQAVVLAPGSSWAQYALALAYWFSGDVGRGLEALETGRALNPNDTTITADLGQRYAMLADWDRAVPLLDEAFARNPAQPGTYRIGMFLYHYAHGRLEEALAEARAVGAANIVYGWIAIAAAAAKLGRAGEAAVAVDAILAIDPRYGERVVEDLQARHLDPGLLRAVIDGLRLAGLPGIDAEPSIGKTAGSAAAGHGS
jgi:tetratricopeptide (TPR) repeat protein